MRLFLPNAEATQAAGERFAAICVPGDCIALTGDLGAGKTTFARGFITALAGDVEVTSPTYTLMQSYETPAATLSHLDLYRLKHSDELAELGLEEVLSGITLIEWPQIADAELPPSRLTLTLENAGQGRVLSCAPDGAWYARLVNARIFS